MVYESVEDFVEDFSGQIAFYSGEEDAVEHLKRLPEKCDPAADRVDASIYNDQHDNETG